MTLDLNLDLELDTETPAEVPAFDASQPTVHPPLSLCSSRRRSSIVDVLDSYEEVTRYRERFMTEAQAVAVWDAVWQLRSDVMAALERCEEGERAARWVRDE
jgi:hypothetical protein